jgi:hypothetical protein
MGNPITCLILNVVNNWKDTNFDSQILLTGSYGYFKNRSRIFNILNNLILLNNLQREYALEQFILSSATSVVHQKSTNNEVLYTIVISNFTISVDNSFKNVFGTNFLSIILLNRIFNLKLIVLTISIVPLRCLYSFCLMRKLVVT